MPKGAPQPASLQIESSGLGAAVERFMNLSEGEGGRTLRLFSLIFVVSVAMVLLKAAQGGIFLAAYPRKMIPWAFAASALLLTPFSALSVAAAARLGPVRLASLTLFGSGLASLALCGLLFASVPGTPFVIYIVIEAMSGLVLIQIWSVVAGAVDPRSAKRILPIAGVGASVAWTLGGLLCSRIVAIIGAQGLLVVVPLLFGVSIYLVRSVAKQDIADSQRAPPQVSLLAGFRSGLDFVMKVPLMRLCMLLGVLSLVGEQLMDYQLLATARDRYHQQAAIAGFFGHFYGITSAVSLVIQLGFSSRVLAWLGATQGLAVTPIATMFVALAGIIVPGFAPIVLLRANDRVLKTALWSSAMEQTQTPLPVLRRAQARAFSRGVVAPLAYALAAIGLTVLPEQADLRLFSALTMMVVMGMAAIVLSSLRNAYVTALRRAIDDRRLHLDGELTATTLDREAAQAIGSDLANADEAKALLAAEFLVHADPIIAEPLLRVGLGHAASGVRIAVLDGLGVLQSANFEKVCELLTSDPVPEVRRAAARCLIACRAADAAVRRAFESGLADTDSHVRAACKVACVTIDDFEGTRRGTALVPFLEGNDSDLMAAALTALGPRASTTPEVLAALRHCLLASEPPLRLLALQACVRIGARALLNDVGPLLEDPRTAEDAVTQLSQWGEDALEQAARSIGAVKTGIPAASTGSPAELNEGLSSLLGHADAGVRDRATRALVRLVHAGRIKPLRRAAVEPVLEAEIAASFRYLSILAGVARDDGTPDWEIVPEYAFLGGEIEMRFRTARKRVLDLLSLVQSLKLTSVLEAGLRRMNAGAPSQMDAQIAELLEVELPLDLARRIAPLFDKLTLRERLVAAERVELLDNAAIEDPLAFIVELRDAHLRACAIITYGARATARYPEVYKEDAALIPIFERMRFLRSVPLFAEIPGEDLRMVAEILDLVERPAGALVFRKGDPGEDMYLIVRGSVAIRDGNTDLATLGARDFFGELSVIDRDARSADAVALEPAELLRLRAADLGELMARRPQIQEQILLVVVRRLRARNLRAAH